MPPLDLRTDIDALRVAVGDTKLGTVPAHLTLVPPRNVGTADAAPLRRHLRSVAGASQPLRVNVGPAATFWPDSPTLHLEVADAGGALGDLVTALDASPSPRRRTWPFAAHVTLRESLPVELIEAGCRIICGEFGPWEIDRFSLLEQVETDSGRAWVPVDEFPLGAPLVLGRGGIELELDCLRTLTAPVAELLLADGQAVGGLPGTDVLERVHDEGTEPLVLAAYDPAGDVVAAAIGVCGSSPSRLLTVVVRDDWQRMGFGGRLVERWCHSAALEGAGMICARTSDDAGSALLAGRGFTELGDLWVRSTARLGR